MEINCDILFGVYLYILFSFTAIYTAAMEMLGGGSEIAKQCRKPEIIADAAYVILTQDSKSYTGNFCIDDEVLLKAGVPDVSVYDCVPGRFYLILLDYGVFYRWCLCDCAPQN